MAIICTVSSCLAADAIDSWTLRHSAFRKQLNFVTYTGGIFIAGGDEGTLLTSSDGLEWTQLSLEPRFPLRGAASDGGTNFVTIGDGGLTLRSADAKTWSPNEIVAWDRNGTVSTNLQADFGTPVGVSFAGGTFVLGTAGQKGSRLFYSRDLTNWHAASPVQESFLDYQVLSYKVLVPGVVKTTNLLVAAGSIWSPIQLGSQPKGDSLGAWRFEVTAAETGYAQGGAYGNGLFILVGMEMATRVSTNGVEWITLTFGEPPVFPNNPTPDYMRLNYLVATGLAFGNGTFVACRGGADDLLVSTNGFWERRPIQVPKPGLVSIAYGEGRFVAVGGSNVFSSAHVSVPGLSLQNRKGIPPQLELSGEVGQEYQLEQSANLLNWTAADRVTLPLPKVQLSLQQNAPASFYRVRLIPPLPE